MGVLHSDSHLTELEILDKPHATVGCQPTTLATRLSHHHTYIILDQRLLKKTLNAELIQDEG